MQLRELDPERLGDHLDRLYRAAFALCGSREDAEDLTQETYARVLSRPRLLRSEDDLGYLLRVLRNTFLNQKRAESRRARTAPTPEEIEFPETSTWSSPEASFEARQVYETISLLPAEFREALAAVDVAGLSYREASKALGVPEGTIMSRLFRARQQVVRRLDAGTA